MIANFFHSLDRHQVEYLLISGQATVLYGAATFSEDIDLWINPTPENCEKFLLALRECGARYYKLTPPLSAANVQRGHGFHFILPGDGDDDDVFLDIMGSPPRVESFAAVKSTTKNMLTGWGVIPTIGLKSLVELKKTQRLEDYPIISKLALEWFNQPESVKSHDDFKWALQNIFTLPELRNFFTAHPEAAGLLAEILSHELREFGRSVNLENGVAESVEHAVNAQMQQRIGDLQQADRRYWRGIITELKEFRASGKLMPEGQTV